MTLDQIAYNLLNLFRGGRSTNNEHISLEQLKFNIKHYRAVLARRDIERNGSITRHFEQDLGCLDLEVVDASRCCGLPAYCKVSKTKLKLPRTVRLKTVEGFTHIADITGLHVIPLIRPIDVQLLPFDRFTKNEKKAYMIEDYMYIYNAEGIDTINVRMIAEDPEELAKFKCGGGNCYDTASPFPMPMDLIDALTSGLIKGTLQLLPITTSDTENNAIQDSHVQREAPRNVKSNG